MAATGGTRLARIAGKSAASVVTTMPSSSATITVRAATITPCGGDVDAERR